MKNAIIFSISLLAIFAFSQPRPNVTDISGRVMDQTTSQAIVGARVMIKNSNLTAITDTSGRFMITTDLERAVLVVSHLGHFEREIMWEGQQHLNIFLKRNNNTTDLVDVNDFHQPHRVQEAGISDLSLASGLLRVKAQGQRPYQDWTTTQAEDYSYIQENIFRSAETNPTSTFSIDVDHASYSNIRRFLNLGKRPPIDAVRIEEMINYFHYDYPDPASQHPLRIYSEMAPCPWNKDHRLLHVGLKSKSLKLDDLPASNLVFLIDVSGSMASPRKLPLVKKSFELLLDQMRPHDRVAIVTYAGSSGVLLPSTAASEKGEIRAALEQLTPGGSTAGAQGILTAYQVAQSNFIERGNNRIILATDGDFNIGVSSDVALIRLIEKKRSTGIYLSILGFGMGNYKDAKMQKLAQHGNGNHHYVDQWSEAKKVFVHEFSGSIYTVAKDVKIQIEFNPDQVAGYRLVGYENRLLDHADFENDRKDAGEIGAGHQVTALYEIIPADVSSELVHGHTLKYQKRPVDDQRQDEWMTVKLRYKNTDDDQGQEIHQIIKDHKAGPTSQSFNWSAAVAAYGMMLRNSEFSGSADLDLVLKLARQGKGQDPHGYRAEFINLVQDGEDQLLVERE